MKLEYLADGSADCPLIRLYDFSPAEAGQLLTAVSALGSGLGERVEVHELPFVEPIGDGRLVLVRRAWDQAVIRRPGRCEFECGFTAGTWDNVSGLVKPFVEGVGGFQWLAGGLGEAAVLLSASASGQW